jgi:dienelactone hydrolase
MTALATDLPTLSDRVSRWLPIFSFRLNSTPPVGTRAASFVAGVCLLNRYVAGVIRLWLCLVMPAVTSLAAAPLIPLPDQDQRGRQPVTLNTPRTFGTYTNANQWWREQADARNQILVSAGLWPLPPARTPLNAQISGRIERDGYTVEKVQFESFPGLFVGGNLYRPRAREGPFPAMLNPHGHSELGRLTDDTTFSTAARCIQFARMGVVAFSWDMIGYHDTAQFSARDAEGKLVKPTFYDNHVALFRNPTNQLWNLNLLGLQLWNAMRAVDFVAGLPDVNPRAIGCTGESGGGTQTFLLAAVEERVRFSAPIVMVSHTMQGGCWCENAPGLRIRHFNVDFAAAGAPKPQLLVGATGDWTKATLEVEGPAIAGIYKLLDQPTNFAAVRLDFPHNYNRDTREHVYSWVGRWLLGKPAGTPIPETAYTKEADADLLVFPDGKFPPTALNEADFIAEWTKARQAALERLRPTDAASFTNFMNSLRMLQRHTLGLDGSEWDVVPFGAFGRPGNGDRIEKTLLMPNDEGWLDAVVIIAHPGGKGVIEKGGKLSRFAARLVRDGYAVLAFDAFETGRNRRELPPLFDQHFTTYNRTVFQERVQDTRTTCAYAAKFVQGGKKILVGFGEAGAWTMMAGNLVDATIADCEGADPDSPERLMSPTRFFPGARLSGGLPVNTALVAPKTLVLQHTAGKFETGWIRDSYQALGATEKFTEHAGELSEDELFRLVSTLAVREPAKK